jgi:hypothetical protein
MPQVGHDANIVRKFATFQGVESVGKENRSSFDLAQFHILESKLGTDADITFVETMSTRER